MNRIEKLEKIIKKAAELYYTGANIETEEGFLTDAQFDTVVAKLRTLSPDHPLLTTVGWGYEPKVKKEPHSYGVVGSLDVLDFEKCGESSIISPKYDGISISVEYQNGKLVKGLTRGTGTVGMNVTHHLVSMIPLEIPTLKTVCFKGEAVIGRKIFTEKYTNDYANERNFVAGVLNRQSITPITKDIDVVFYQVLGYKSDTSTLFLNDKIRILDFIKRMGLLTAPTYSGPFNREALENWSKAIGYLTDGIVLTHGISSTFKDGKVLISEDSNSHKFESEEKEAVIDSIEWSTGGSGKVVPVITLVSPIHLSGVEVQRATAHNAQNVKDEGIGIGALIWIKRANEVIPYINSVSQPVSPVLPTICPTCKEKLEWVKIEKDGYMCDGADLICPNKDCDAQTSTSIFRLIEVLDIGDGLGETTIKKWLTVAGIQNTKDLLEFANANKNGLVCDDPIVSLGDHYGNLILNLINKLCVKYRERFSFQEFWFILNLKTLGHRNAKKMSGINPLNVTSPDDILSQVKDIVSKPVRKALQERFEYWTGVLSLMPIKEEKVIETKATSYKVCITGKLNGFKNRNAFVKYLEQFGVEHTTVNKTTDYLISNSISSSSKFTKAKKLGIPIISEEDFLSIIK